MDLYKREHLYLCGSCCCLRSCLIGCSMLDKGGADLGSAPLCSFANAGMPSLAGLPSSLNFPRLAASEVAGPSLAFAGKPCWSCLAAVGSWATCIAGNLVANPQSGRQHTHC